MSLSGHRGTVGVVVRLLGVYITFIVRKAKVQFPISTAWGGIGTLGQTHVSGCSVGCVGQEAGGWRGRGGRVLGHGPAEEVGNGEGLPTPFGGSPRRHNPGNH